ncbi:phosphoribosylanthranilate isomerase [Petrotoga sp. 9PWA.NaAc.5.4]|uniref:phosphoribosylanthranilate isomerase n=1 Tax=Petrotoga sp. 9PWA.NaAc.5.4 TaxID=1434328 RepID=UPI000CB5F110|nr:phosphoribosylanthranilate isomerase [Petrotoga sp. 9PWA.NaAc.5.4]PNR93956.1 N-(5'-phosphoribosyl)anthranilate isomerase [Petrotoga sp. 9PWA.NaAc.5.4]
MVRIKICGITNLKDALEISSLNIHALGFILSDSPRKIKLSEAIKISSFLPPFINRVAVVVNPSILELESIENSKAFDYVQFHGNEDLNLIKRCKLKTIKAIKISKETSTNNLNVEELKEIVDYFLFDTKVEQKLGGTGKTFDWNILKKLNINKPFILAGGIGPDNVIQALNELNPVAIDLNSKVEESPGKKNINLIKKTLEIIKNT